MNIMTLEQIVVDLPIYGTFSFSLFGDKPKSFPVVLSNDAQAQLSHLFQTTKVDIMCVDCKKEHPFDVSHVIVKNVYKENNYSSFNSLVGRTDFFDIDSKEMVRTGIQPPKEDEGIVSYLFKCNMNPTHYQTMDLHYCLKNNVITIRKIGQKPLNVDLQNRHSNEYKTILNIYDSFEDYRHYEQCESRDLLAGACTYLRRILEKMVYVKLKNAGKTEQEIKTLNRFEDKIKEVKDEFDDDIQEILSQSYGLLSKGIHELSNDEIETFYKLILEVINIQLESEKEKKERDEKRKRLRSEINKASS